MKVMWTNKFSREQGYVKEIKKKEGHFVNTFDKAEAKSYTPKGVAQVLKTLPALCGDNEYEAVEDGNDEKANAPP
jgi:hypothetical protein